jgi:hypothetical protein
MDWNCGSVGRALTLQAQSTELKPQSQEKKEKKKKPAANLSPVHSKQHVLAKGIKNIMDSMNIQADHEWSASRRSSVS